ncbi:hypothetical protein HKX17_17480 [Sulfitobacter sp. KE34]|uniref:hypothetical protein n=1 Tax=unclassified Sulfitobacter TaxID=196795 RepID=UPI0023E2452D|nr:MULTISPECIES: hypothetical protein [unclassified Sulfitobacter]MDF3352057.1 hypothetical protein [Sulfitobacter sp. KE12]MDF3355739.1 hypothetical protein [Sulfitobacter sp. KE27]MDF3359256.1 hypothetical protein [Sulfitobacter sp. KE33]MDF3366680.1 hypothetical protein [Sulfitobacter sp. Ks34]MDF3370425.1 hypothetical protein [Sulfitobacter sp. Ks43]
MLAQDGQNRSRWVRARQSALLPALVALLLGGLLQEQTYLNHDVAWVLNSSERLLKGGTFGREIVAANPPLIWWLNAPVAWLARLLGTEPVTTFRAVVLGLLALSLATFNCALPISLSRPRHAMLLTGLALVLTFGAGRDFGQREHLAVALNLPWLMLMAARAEGSAVSPLAAVLAGLAAGLGICFKPHFLVVPVLVGLYAVARQRSLRPMLSLENLTIVLTGVAYVAATWFFARPYLAEVVPLISQVYWGFSHPVYQVVLSQPLPLVLCAVTLATALRRWRSAAPMVIALAATGFLVAALAQAKGYSYHFYPVTGLALLSLALSALHHTRTLLVVGSVLTLGLTLLTIQSTVALGHRMTNGAYGTATACLVSMVQNQVPEGGAFMAFSTHPYPGFPVANYSHRRWVAATNSRLYLPAIVRLRAQEVLAPEAAKVLALAEQAERAAALKDMFHRPALVLIDAREHRHAIGTLPMDYEAFYTEDPAFARIWSGYQEINSCVPGIRAFKLTEEA